MKGVIVEKLGGDLKVVSDLEKPRPGADQLLVKSLIVAMNPVCVYHHLEASFIDGFAVTDS